MTGYLGSRWIKFGIILLSIGAAPLIGVVRVCLENRRQTFNGPRPD